MKVTTTTCDMCLKEIGGEHITIGSERGGELRFENNLPDKAGNALIHMFKYRDLHFCSKEHFINYFFDRGNPL